MVDSIRPTHRTIPAGSATKYESSAASVDSHRDEKQPKAHIPRHPNKERRNRRDRRGEQQNLSRSVYELRSGKDRRKNDRGHPTIEIDV